MKKNILTLSLVFIFALACGSGMVGCKKKDKPADPTNIEDIQNDDEALDTEAMEAESK